MKPRILFVDDEKAVLDGLQRSLRATRKDWELCFAQSGQEALQFLARQPAEVIVADMRMPGMGGAELLVHVRERHPSTVRLTLSGSDHEIVVEAAGLAHLSLLKPCDTEVVVQSLKRATRLHALMTRVRGALGTLLPGGASPDEPAALELAPALRAVVEHVRSEWTEPLEIATAFDPSLPPVRCVPAELALAVVNLLLNAAEAIAETRKGGGGRIELAVRGDRDQVEIAVSDNAAGIAEDIRPYLFQPLFTTREGKGTGQGLAVARVAVQRQGGTISFETELGRGSRFAIRLPAKSSQEVA